MRIVIHHKIEIVQGDELKDSLNSIHQKLDLIMAKQEQFDAMIQRLNAATNDIAADLAKLKADIQNGTVSDASLQQLDTNIQQLEALGASTENPVPEPPAEEPGTGTGEEEFPTDLEEEN